MNAAVVIAAAMKAGEVLDRKIFASSTALRKEMEERDIDTRTPGASERFKRQGSLLHTQQRCSHKPLPPPLPPSFRTSRRRAKGHAYGAVLRLLLQRGRARR